MRIHDQASTARVLGPTVNLNGSGANDLVEQLRGAIDAVRAAEDALAKATPHGRDYQIGPVKYQDARDAHSRRMSALDTIYNELLAIAIDVMDQKSAREERRT